MDDGQSAVLQEFMMITGVDDMAAALNVLEATNWVLEDAVNLQFATGGETGGAGPASGAGPAGIPDLPSLEEEEVRAPLPVVRERLYGDAGQHGIPPGRVASYAPRGAAVPDRGPTHIDVFQDHEAPQAAAAGTSFQPLAAAGSSGASLHSQQRLSDLFKPPAGLLCEGDFDSAKAHATKQGRWLLVNVQTADEFASHQLNRDTWSQSLVQDMLRETFVFWQVYNTSQQGGALAMQYHLEKLPATFIVDPITGAKLWQKEGFISADALIEELVSFMDVGPNDPGASALANRFHAQAAKRRTKPSDTGYGGDVMMTEDDDLALALAMSVEEQGAAGGAGPSGHEAAAAAGASRMDDDDLDEEAIWKEIHRRQQEEAAAAAAATAAGGSGGSGGVRAAASGPAVTPATASPAAEAAAIDVASVQAAAAARLPAEPAAGSAGSCRVAFRLPDGSRVQRTFSTTDTVAALQDFVVSVSSDAAQMPKFVLSEPRPGSAPLADPTATIAQAGVANAMLVLKLI